MASQEPTTPALVELTHHASEAVNRRGLDEMLRFYAPDAVLELRGLGITSTGHAAIRGHLSDWFGSYEEYEFRTDEVHDLVNGVVFAVVSETARPVGVTG